MRLSLSLSLNQSGCMASDLTSNVAVGEPTSTDSVWMVPYQSVGWSTAVSFTGLSLCYGGHYAVLVRAVSLSGVVGEAVSSDGVTINPSTGCLLSVQDAAPYTSTVTSAGVSWTAVMDPIDDDVAYSALCPYTTSVGQLYNTSNSSFSATAIDLLADPTLTMEVSVALLVLGTAGSGGAGNFSTNFTLITNETVFNWTSPTFNVFGNVNTTGPFNFSTTVSNGTGILSSNSSSATASGSTAGGVFVHAVDVSSPFSPCCFDVRNGRAERVRPGHPVPSSRSKRTWWSTRLPPLAPPPLRLITPTQAIAAYCSAALALWL